MNTRKMLVIISVATVLGILVLASFWVLNDRVEPHEISLERQIQESLIERIANYDVDSPEQTTVQGATIATGTPSMHSGTDASRSSSTVPEGYSVVQMSPSMTVMQAHDSSVDLTGSDNQVRSVEWLQSATAVDGLVKQAESAGRDWTYGFMQINRAISSDQMQREINSLGVRILGVSGDIVRLRVPANGDQLEALRNLPWVAGVGALPAELKTSTEFIDMTSNSVASQRHPVFITVVDAESEKSVRDELTQLGVATGHFDRDIRAFAAVIHSNQLWKLSQLDFVQKIEPIGIVKAVHDTVVQSMGADAIRAVGQARGVFTGSNGASVPIGVLDTGLNTNHIDISSLRSSICGSNFIEFEDSDLWVDAGFHGSHVTGSVVGNGYYEPIFAGMAPGVQHIRFGKVLSVFGGGDLLTVSRGMDFLSRPSACTYNGVTSDPIKPLIVNMSLAASGLSFDSRSADSRKLDAIVWGERQLYVVANSNDDVYGYSNYAASKNSLSVGASHDFGDKASFSSRGPTVDGRLVPSVMGVGVEVYSVKGGGDFDTYDRSDGTSMASPIVAGVAALLMDASPEHQENPALTRARLMASAIKPDPWFAHESAFPTNNSKGPGTINHKHGLGFVSARTAILDNDSDTGWVSGGTTVELNDGEYGYHDISVPEGASRIDIVLTWDEPPTDTVSPVVLNDLNLWVDQEADCGSGACGEYSSESTIDNVEWVIIQDPEPGTYRLKVDGHRVYSIPPRAAIAWTVIRGDSAPQLSVTATQEVYETPALQNHKHDVELTVTADSYVASGTRLHIDCRTVDNQPCTSIGIASDFGVEVLQVTGLVQREDGLGLNSGPKQFLTLGEIAVGETQNVRVSVGSESSDAVRLYFTATAFNGIAGTATVVFRQQESNENPTEASQPDNDSFATPIQLQGDQGSREFDPLISSAESGEPPPVDNEIRPASSVWFNWVPDTSGPVTFLAVPRNEDPAVWGINNRVFTPQIDVFEVKDDCCGLAGSPQRGTAPWSVPIFAQVGNEYRVRVSHRYASLPLTLNWVSGDRPVNDDFANATPISGGDGEIAGQNAGATLEPGERYGDLASSVWYQWTAPTSGTYEISVSNAPLLHVLVFEGDDVRSLRLVSGFAIAGEGNSFPAGEGKTYRIMVASADASSGGWKYDQLSWYDAGGADDSFSENLNDLFGSAETIASENSGSVSINVLEQAATVEPDEPEETGIMTRWWKWTAPKDGEFTWFWDSDLAQIFTFTGTAVNDLTRIVEEAQAVSGQEFVLNATKDTEYLISAGIDKLEYIAFTPQIGLDTTLYWGETPTNNTLANAQVLSGASGEASGSWRYATTESDGRSGLGQSSLWYTHTVEKTGWVRFWIGGANNQVRMTVFLQSGEGDLKLIMSADNPGRRNNNTSEVYVYVEEGSTIVLRVANATNHSSSNFKLEWEPSEAPQWLRYIGRVADGRRDASGTIVSLPNPRNMEFNADGSGLFVTNDRGLSSFDRDPDTGELFLMGEVSAVHARSNLVWDVHRSRLYANHMQSLWTLEPYDDDPLVLQLVGSQQSFDDLEVVSNQKGSPALFLDPEGNYLYRSLNDTQAVLSFSSTGELGLYGSFRVKSSAKYPSTDESLWYSTGGGSIRLEQRIVGSPFFERLDGKIDVADARTIASSHTDQHAFAPSSTGEEVLTLAVDRADGTLTEAARNSFFDLNVEECWSVSARRGKVAVDVLCDQGVFVAEFDADAKKVVITDNFSTTDLWFFGFTFISAVPDRFGNTLPAYKLSESVAVATSPDGKHLYASTLKHGILMFERFGNETVDIQESLANRVKRLDLIQASPNRIEFHDDSADAGCIEASSWTVDDVSYSVTSSKWQERDIGQNWTDVADTSKDGELCSYLPTENKEYRLIATLNIEGESADYASNFFAYLTYERLDSLSVTSGQITLDGMNFSECTTINEMEISGKTYSVASSKWQVRDNDESNWADLSNSQKSGEVCPLDPDDTRQYRLVGRFAVDGTRAFYTSDTLTEN